MKSKKIGMSVIVAFCAMAFGLVAAQARAAVIIYTPSIQSVSSEYSFDNRLASHLVDNSGLAFAPPTTINSTADLPNHDEAPTTVSSPAHTPTHGGMWLTENGNGDTATIVFNLGAVETINVLYIWNYSEVPNASTSPVDETGRGVKGVNIFADNTVNPTIPVPGALTQFTQATFASGTTANVGGAGGWNLDYDTAVVAYPLTTPITAQYIKFDISSSWSDPSFVGLDEVRFGFVPEPSAGLLLACGGAAMLARQRKAHA